MGQIGAEPCTTVVILNGTATSPAINLRGFALCGIQWPANLVGTAVTLQGSFDGTTFATLTKVDGTAYTLTVAATASYQVIPPADLAGVNYIKLVMGGNQSADRTITLVGRSV